MCCIVQVLLIFTLSVTIEGFAKVNRYPVLVLIQSHKKTHNVLVDEFQDNNNVIDFGHRKNLFHQVVKYIRTNIAKNIQRQKKYLRTCNKKYDQHARDLDDLAETTTCVPINKKKKRRILPYWTNPLTMLKYDDEIALGRTRTTEMKYPVIVIVKTPQKLDQSKMNKRRIFTSMQYRAIDDDDDDLKSKVKKLKFRANEMHNGGVLDDGRRIVYKNENSWLNLLGNRRGKKHNKRNN